MWELVRKVSRGRYPGRRFSLMVTATVLAFFVATFALSETAYADTAARNGETISYQNNTYEEVKKEALPKDIQDKAQGGYRYLDTTGKKAHFIFTADAPSKAATGFYVIYDFTPPDNFSNPSPPVEVTFDEGTSASTSDCGNPELSGIGWLACPIVTFLAGSMDTIYDVISNFLVVNTITNNTDSSIYQLWMVVRDIANICFVIAILAVVYSQITSIGITNYGIKKILPRLVIAAILVNVSYWVCAVAVDASNVIGFSIHQLFTGIMDKFNVGANYNGVGNVPTWQEAALWTLSGGTVAIGLFAAGTFGGALALLLPFLLSAIVAALVALIILAARQAMITVLIIISPLAFVAYVLPNTEKWFTKWRETLMTMLLLFPIFSVVFSGAQLAGMAIAQSANGNIFTILLGMAVQVAPIVITPLLVKFSGSLIGRIAGIVNNPGKGLIDRSRNAARGFAEQQRDKVAGRQNKVWTPLGAPTRMIDTYKRNLAKNRESYKSAAGNRYDRTNSGQKAEELKRRIGNDTKRVDNEFFQKRGMPLELESRNLDVDKQELETVMTGSAGGQRLTFRQGMAEVNKTNAQNDFEGSSLGRQVSNAKRTAELHKQRVENDHQAAWDNSVRTDASVLEVALAAKHSEGRVSTAKEKLERMHAEIATQGHESEHILNLRGTSAATQAGLLNIAHDINRDRIETVFASAAKTEAEHKLSSDTNEVLLKNSMTFDGVAARKYAAGIGSEANVLASAVARERKEFGEGVGYQSELKNHFKLNAKEIENLAMAKGDVTVTDDHGNTHTFELSNDHVRDMAVEEIFTVGSHNQKLSVLMSSGKKGINYGNRRTIQQAAIKSGISSIAPAIADKTLDAINNGEFNGMESFQYHSFREVLEGRIKAGSLSSANADSLRLLFEDVDKNALTRTQFNKLIDDSVGGELEAMRVTNSAATEADARASLLNKFNQERKKMQNMAVQVLSNTTIRQNTNSQSVEVLKGFAGSLYKGD